MSNHYCPKCHSEQIQTLQMVFENGTATAVHNSSGVGVGIGSGGSVGLGFGGSRTTSTSISTLAAKVAPPQPRKMGIFMAGIFLPVLALVTNNAGVMFVAVLIAAGCFVMGMKMKRWNKTELPKLVAQWERRWLCHRCGNVFDLN
jgi:hypothetical protein